MTSGRAATKGMRSAVNPTSGSASAQRQIFMKLRRNSRKNEKVCLGMLKMLNSGLRCLKIQPCTLNIHLSKTAACFFTLGGGCDLTAGGRRKPNLTRRQEELQKSARLGSEKVEKPLALFLFYNASTQTQSKTAAAVSTTAAVPCLSGELRVT